MQDSRVVAASLRSEDAVPATNAADARMHMQVLDKMLAKRKSLRDVFVRLERDTSGHVGVKNIREQ